MAGNANSGRRLDRSITDALRRALLQNDNKVLDNVVRAWTSAAQAGDLQAIAMIVDRLEGKPMQQIESHNVNENHFVKAPEKASKDDWAQYLAHKAKSPVAKEKTNCNSNGKSH